MSRSTELPVRFRRKVVVYATWEERLLVFREPEFPEVGLQVPGGTIEEDESIEAAARREFSEETGLPAPRRFDWLGENTYRFESETFEAGATRFEHRRSYFHTVLERAPQAEWEWTEATPDGGGPPIRMRFSLVPLLPRPDLFGGLGAFLPGVLERLGLTEAI